MGMDRVVTRDFNNRVAQDILLARRHGAPLANN